MKTNKNKQDKTTTIDMPEVSDIPGQENVRPPKMGEMIDTTISSDDEEGKGIVDDLNEPHPVNPMDQVDNNSMPEATNVSDEERELLERTDRTNGDDTETLERIALDDTDGEDPLNESGDLADMGEDLDVPGSEEDDDNEEIGEEDEENNSYSTRD